MKLRPKRFQKRYMVSKWNLRNSKGNEWNCLLPIKHEDRIASKRFHFDDALQFVSQIYSYASSNEDSGCTCSSGHGMEKAPAKQ